MPDEPVEPEVNPDEGGDDGPVVTPAAGEGGGGGDDPQVTPAAATATTIGIRGLNRRGVRIGKQVATSKATIQVDVDDPTVRRDLSRHSAIGAIIVVQANSPT